MGQGYSHGGQRDAKRSWRCEWALAALLGSLLLRCGVTCPEGTRARFDQCVRLSSTSDAGGDAPTEAARSDASETDAGGDAPPNNVPADAGDAAEAEAGCGVQYMWHDGRCVPREVYVDSQHGNDENDGTADSPLKTFMRSVGDAAPGQILNFEPGVYTVELNGSFSGVIPPGVTLRTTPGATGVATIAGGGRHSLTSAGSATLENVVLAGFNATLTATQGEQTWTNVTVSGSREGLTMMGSARFTCDGCRFEGERQVSAVLITVRGAATATVAHSVLTAEDHCQTPLGMVNVMIHVRDSANLVLDDVRLNGSFGRGVLADSTGNLAIRSTTVGPGCDEATSVEWARIWNEPSAATVDIHDSTFAGTVGGGGGSSRVRVRGSTFQAAFTLGMMAGGVYDLGFSARDGGVADPGRNTFVFLHVVDTGATILASGNTWNPNEQGADAQGHYAHGEVVTVGSGEVAQGANYSVRALEAPVQILF